MIHLFGELLLHRMPSTAMLISDRMMVVLRTSLKESAAGGSRGCRTPAESHDVLLPPRQSQKSQMQRRVHWGHGSLQASHSGRDGPLAEAKSPVCRAETV